jgi:hypothetical protein
MARCSRSCCPACSRGWQRPCELREHAFTGCGKSRLWDEGAQLQLRRCKGINILDKHVCLLSMFVPLQFFCFCHHEEAFKPTRDLLLDFFRSLSRRAAKTLPGDPALEAAEELLIVRCSGRAGLQASVTACQRILWWNKPPRKSIATSSGAATFVLAAGVSPRESGINQKPRSGDTGRDTVSSGQRQRLLPGLSSRPRTSARAYCHPERSPLRAEPRDLRFEPRQRRQGLRHSLFRPAAKRFI